MSNNTWKGFKDFIVYDKVQEDEVVTSFYLKAADGMSLPKAIPGQFIAVRIKKAENEYSRVRQYTLSMDSREEFYRISVKIEHEGDLSKQLCNNIKVGDKIQATIPMGKFILKDGDSPVVLIGGGIGITPMLAMAYAARDTNRVVKLVYSTTNSKYHSFKEELSKLKYENNNIDVLQIYTRPLEDDKLNEDYNFEGRINKEWIENNLPKNGEFYFCGSIEFMRTVYKNLEVIGVDKSKINYELFTPGEDITK